MDIISILSDNFVTKSKSLSSQKTALIVSSLLWLAAAIRKDAKIHLVCIVAVTASTTVSGFFCITASTNYCGSVMYRGNVLKQAKLFMCSNSQIR